MATEPTKSAEQQTTPDAGHSGQAVDAARRAGPGEPVTAYPNWDAGRGALVLDPYDPGTDYIRAGAPSATLGDGQGAGNAGDAAALKRAAADLIAEIVAKAPPTSAPPPAGSNGPQRPSAAAKASTAQQPR